MGAWTGGQEGACRPSACRQASDCPISSSEPCSSSHCSSSSSMRLPCSPCSAMTFWRSARRSSEYRSGSAMVASSACSWRAAFHLGLDLGEPGFQRLAQGGEALALFGLGAALGLAVDDGVCALPRFRASAARPRCARPASRGSPPGRRRTRARRHRPRSRNCPPWCAADAGRARPAACCRQTPPARRPGLRGFSTSRWLLGSSSSSRLGFCQTMSDSASRLFAAGHGADLAVDRVAGESKPPR